MYRWHSRERNPNLLWGIIQLKIIREELLTSPKMRFICKGTNTYYNSVCVATLFVVFNCMPCSISALQLQLSICAEFLIWRRENISTIVTNNGAARGVWLEGRIWSVSCWAKCESRKVVNGSGDVSAILMQCEWVINWINQEVKCWRRTSRKEVDELEGRMGGALLSKRRVHRGRQTNCLEGADVTEITGQPQGFD